MKFLISFVVACFAIIYTESVKRYQFRTIEACNTDNEVVGEITKCEVDGTYFTFHVFVKVPFTKVIVRLLFKKNEKVSMHC